MWIVVNPTVDVIWTYMAMSPDDLAERVRSEGDRRLGRKKRRMSSADRAHAFGVAGYFLGRS
jgi:hypothetical protein